MSNPKPKLSRLAVLTAAEALEIFRLAHKSELTQKALAKRFRVSQSTISNIVNRRVYKPATERAA